MTKIIGYAIQIKEGGEWQIVDVFKANELPAAIEQLEDHRLVFPNNKYELIGLTG